MNWNIIGHQKIIHFLEAAIVNNKLAQAYLFYGPAHLGKKVLTKKFIQILMCYYNEPNKSNIPCEECVHCQQIEKNIHADIFWLKKEPDKKDISIEQIRELQHSLSVYSLFKSYKIAVIEGAEFLNLASANALLKTLEEPSKRTVIILIADHLGKIPKTILSRTQKIKFLPLPTKEIYDYLVNQNVDRDQARHLSNLSNGRPGRALIFLNNSEMWPAYLSQLKVFFSLIMSSRVNKIKFAAKFLAGKESLLEKINILMPTLNLWQLIIRDLILSKLNQNDKIINSLELNKIIKISQDYSLEKLINLQKYIELTKQQLRLNVNPQLALENLLLSF